MQEVIDLAVIVNALRALASTRLFEEVARPGGTARQVASQNSAA